MRIITCPHCRSMIGENWKETGWCPECKQPLVAEFTLCDFCSTETTELRRYEPLQHIKEVRAAGYAAPVNDTGPWCACKDCEKLIEADDWHGLMERALVPLLKVVPDAPRAIHIEAVKSMWVVVFGEDRVKL